MQRQVREMKPEEFDLAINYFLEADEAFLRGMGVEPSLLPERNDWRHFMIIETAKPIPERQHYFVIWELDGRPVGHSNMNELTYGQEAKMHLHLWQPDARRHGNGSYFVRESINHYFETFQLKRLYCQPYAHNPAPNRTLAKLGFELLETVHLAPGSFSFPQDVNIWLMTREKWLS